MISKAFLIHEYYDFKSQGDCCRWASLAHQNPTGSDFACGWLKYDLVPKKKHTIDGTEKHTGVGSEKLGSLVGVWLR